MLGNRVSPRKWQRIPLVFPEYVFSSPSKVNRNLPGLPASAGYQECSSRQHRRPPLAILSRFSGIVTLREVPHRSAELDQVRRDIHTCPHRQSAGLNFRPHGPTALCSAMYTSNPACHEDADAQAVRHEHRAGHSRPSRPAHRQRRSQISPRDLDCVSRRRRIRELDELRSRQPDVDSAGKERYGRGYGSMGPDDGLEREGGGEVCGMWHAYPCQGNPRSR